MNQSAWIFLVLLAGALLPVQAGLNARMGKAIQNPVWAALISFVVGAVALFIYVLLTRSSINGQGFREIPPLTWAAGVLGAFYVTVVVLAFPRLGPALTFGLVVAGQLFISLLLDHYNILVHQQHSMNAYRFLGVLLIITGVVLIRKF